MVHDPLGRDICNSDGLVMFETPDIGEIRQSVEALKFIDGSKLQVPLDEVQNNELRKYFEKELELIEIAGEIFIEEVNTKEDYDRDFMNDELVLKYLKHISFFKKYSLWRYVDDYDNKLMTILLKVRNQRIIKYDANVRYLMQKFTSRKENNNFASMVKILIEILQSLTKSSSIVMDQKLNQTMSQEDVQENEEKVRKLAIDVKKFMHQNLERMFLVTEDFFKFVYQLRAQDLSNKFSK